MTRRPCPHCGGDLGAPAAHRGELERQLGDAALAANLRDRARLANETHGKPVPLAGTAFIAWRGYVWAKVRVRKPARCMIECVPIEPGAWAWRQLSEVKDRDLRVAADTWAALA